MWRPSHQRWLDSAGQAFEEIADGSELGFDDRVSNALAQVVMNSDGNACLMRDQADILVLVHRVLPPVMVWI